MVNSHTAVAIAQTVFYAPIVPLAFYIFIRNWTNGPLLAWYPFLVFTPIRLVGGILVIVLASNPDNLGLIIAATVLLNVGLIPLLVSTLGLIRMLVKSNIKGNFVFLHFTRVIRVAIVAAVLLLVISGIITKTPSSVQTAKDLARAGYIVFTVILAMMIVMLVHLHGREANLVESDVTYLRGIMLAMLPLFLRAIYGLLYVFIDNSIYSTWNPLFGSAVAFALMALLPEYIVLCIYIYLGFYRIRTCAQPQQRDGNENTNAVA